MKQVLLVIDGETVTNAAFQYAVDLCKRMKAELGILQFMRKKCVDKCISDTGRGLKNLGRKLEATFAAAAFMEEGDDNTAREILSKPSPAVMKLLPRSKKAGVPCNICLSDEEPETELPEYVDNHQNIVLTILDSSRNASTSQRNGADLKTMKKKLPVPLAVVK